MLIQFNSTEIVLLSLLAACLLVQLWFTLFVHNKLAVHHVEEIPESVSGPISVIICARNEVENLKRFLPSILGQEYPQFEVIVVNDRSWDGTHELLEVMAAQNRHLKVVTVAEGEKFIAGKKFAVTMGIKAASYPWLVFTDADCQPASTNWLKGMQPPKEAQTEIVLGYSPYFKKISFLNVLIRFETFFTAVNYLSFALRGMPYMGVGRNLAYKKELFFRNKGFAAHMHVPSGDDDLFVNANATDINTQIVINKETHVWSKPNTSWIKYLRQKKRHVGAGRLYKPSHKFILTLQIVCQFFFYMSFAALCCFRETLYPAIALLVLSIIVRSFVYPKLLKRLDYGELRWWFPVLDVVLFLFLTFNAVASVFIKKVKWR